MEGGLGVVGTMANLEKGNASAQGIDSKIFQHFKQELTEKDYDNAGMEIEEALKELTKANIIELRQVSKPHPLVEKSLQIVCALRGFKNLTWATARDILGRGSFKVEL